MIRTDRNDKILKMAGADNNFERKKVKIGMSIGERFGDEKYNMLKKHGFDYADFSILSETDTQFYTLSENEALKLIEKEKNLSRKAGVVINQVHGPWRWPAKDFTEEDRAERMEKMKRSIRLTAKLGCKYWVVHPIMPFGVEEAGKPEAEKTWEFNVKFMKKLLEEAKVHGITICLENMPMLEFSLAKPKDILCFVKEINDDNFKICLDTGHVAVAAYFVLTNLEKKKMITYTYKKEQKNNFFEVFKTEKFLFYIIISILAEITSTSINFWIPTYLTEYLGFNYNTANLIFTIKSILRAASPFIAIAIYEKIKDEIKIMKHSFFIAGILLISMLFAKNIWLNIFLFFISLVVSGFSAAMLWSIYIPSLKSTGKVSSANGILDFTGYIGAAAANMVFALLTDKIGWNNIIILWSTITFFGFAAATAEQIVVNRKPFKREL